MSHGAGAVRHAALGVTRLVKARSMRGTSDLAVRLSHHVCGAWVVSSKKACHNFHWSEKWPPNSANRRSHGHPLVVNQHGWTTTVGFEARRARSAMVGSSDVQRPMCHTSGHRIQRSNKSGESQAPNTCRPKDCGTCESCSKSEEVRTHHLIAVSSTLLHGSMEDRSWRPGRPLHLPHDEAMARTLRWLIRLFSPARGSLHHTVA